ncbi:MAG: M20/M25/M40 family metallo-hydrolase [Clostridia bacterium]|nr:M20/M25/M40 family metallo-hydrolase [Clostridia bacterium]
MINRDMLKNVLETYGPSGHEQRISEVIKGYLNGCCDEIYNDTLGNLIAHKKGTSGKKVMLSAHMDQIGLIAVDIDENGFIRVSNVGGVNPTITIARDVVFENGTKGVVHFETEKKKAGEATLAELFVDIGASSKSEAEKCVNIGDMAVYAAHYTDMGNRISCGAMDNRICCALLITIMQNLKTEHDVYAVFTVQEEVGLRGAGAAAYAIDPDLNINLDVTTCGDMPKAAPMSTGLGRGAAIKVMDSSVIVPECVRRFLVDTAEEKGITYQMEVLRGGGTDTAAVQKTKSGILAGCVSVPTRYIHSPVETIDMRDAENAVALFLAALEKKTRIENRT